jgi:hypothetical protein
MPFHSSYNPGFTFNSETLNFAQISYWITGLFYFYDWSSLFHLVGEHTLIYISYGYWTVHHLTSWINWTNLMSLHENIYCSTCFECYYIHPQEPATACRYIFLFRCVLVYLCGSAGVGWYPNWSTSAPTCIRIPPYSSRTVPIHQYTPKQNYTPT